MISLTPALQRAYALLICINYGFNAALRCSARIRGVHDTWSRKWTSMRVHICIMSRSVLHKKLNVYALMHESSGLLTRRRGHAGPPSKLFSIAAANLFSTSGNLPNSSSLTALASYDPCCPCRTAWCTFSISACRSFQVLLTLASPPPPRCS